MRRSLYDAGVPPSYDVDLSRFPIVMTALSDDQDLAELGRMIDRYYTAVLERGEPYVSVVDARGVYSLPTARMRGAIADARRRGTDRGVDRLILGIAVITSNRFLRSAIAVIEWISPLTRTTTVVATPDEAIAWAHRLLARARPSPDSTPEMPTFPDDDEEHKRD